MPTLLQRTKLCFFSKYFHIAFFTLIVFTAFILLSLDLWRDEASYSTNKLISETNSDLDFYINIQKLSFEDSTFQVSFTITPYNHFSDDNETLSKPIIVSMGDTPKEFKANSTYSFLRGVSSSTDLYGDQGSYPLDKWIGFATFSVFVNSTTSTAPPKLSFTKNSNVDQELIGYSSLGAAMLFAMLSVRSSQPGVPTVVCWTDVLGFLWFNLILCVCMVCLIVTALITQIRRKDTTETARDEERAEETGATREEEDGVRTEADLTTIGRV
ncbi:hypothetical protein BC936DRAFT_141908 [Jimgerdemannia flammicorona]|uniref:Uncharacterized protein n=1 Tax=Jimgerdemannia flammicorona TaxID=994334 RepID=A0A433DFS2_9FUNG|nr:hypothetical protein BC936DRAFT_141908 [Jimgerdemannia flammicorona]